MWCAHDIRHRGRRFSAELISELCVRRPELIAKSDESRYLEAVHYAVAARQLLNYFEMLHAKF
jgi:hypothetical protein